MLPRINSWLPSLPSCVTSDKLAVPLSSPVVTLDKLKFTHQSFCPLLIPQVRVYKTIILELVRNSGGQSKNFVDYSFKISRPVLLDQTDGEAFARDHYLIRFRFIFNSAASNSVITLSDCALINIQNRSVDPVSVD